MATKTFEFDFVSALLAGILFWALATILQTTAIFGMIANLPAIGLFLGILIGGLRERIPILK
jgi:hypothetical protein